MAIEHMGVIPCLLFLYRKKRINIHVYVIDF